MQEKQILRLTYIVNQLEKKVTKSDALLKANEELNREMEEMKRSELQRLKDHTLAKSVRELFSPAQLYLLENPNRSRCHWREEDKNEMIELYNCGKRAYNLLRRKGFPLASESTLKKWKKGKRTEDDDFAMNDKDNHNNSDSETLDCVDEISKVQKKFEPVYEFECIKKEDLKMETSTSCYVIEELEVKSNY